jgi:hypothetical protein
MVTYKNKVVQLQIWISDNPAYKVIGKINLPLLEKPKFLNICVSVLIFFTFGISIEFY